MLAAIKKRSITKYWSGHNVTSHAKFTTAQESLDYFQWRNAQYFNYIQLMPVTQLNDKVILDFGCGPGNDLVGFGHYSKPKRLIGMDVSQPSLMEAKERLQLHQIYAELHLIEESTSSLKIEDQSIDYIHCSGVLHHMSNPSVILKEFRRILKPTGQIRIMVYNYYSLWVHLYVAYVKKIVKRQFSNMSIREAFSKTTDGKDCPVSNVYTPNEFIELCRSTGLQAKFLGAAISMWELSLLDQRFKAIMSLNFPKEHRDFILALRFDELGYPIYQS